MSHLCGYDEDLIEEVASCILEELTGERPEVRLTVARHLMADGDIGSRLSFLERREVTRRVWRGDARRVDGQ